MSPTVLCDTIHLLLSGDKASNNLSSTPNKCFQFNDLRKSAHYWLTLLLFPINLRKRWVNNYFTGFYQSPETALLQPNGSFCLGLWEKKYIVGKNKVSKNIVAQQSSMNKTSKLPTLTHWSGNIGHEKVLKLSPGFTIFDLNMRKLGRLGTKTKHKDLSNFVVSLIGRKTNFERQMNIFDFSNIFSIICFRTIGLLGSSPIELNPDFQSDQPVDLHTPPVCQVKS